MARVTFNPESGIQSLSGTVGRLTFRTRNGKTFVTSRPEPELPKHPTRAQRRQYQRQTMIDDCLEILQGQITDIRQAIQSRAKMKSRLEALYKKYSATIKARTKLQKAIMSEYYARYSTDIPSMKTRRSPDEIAGPDSTRRQLTK